MLNPYVVYLKLIQYCKLAIFHLGNRKQLNSPANAAGPKGLAHNSPHDTCASQGAEVTTAQRLGHPGSIQWGGGGAVTPVHTPVGAGY